jgi:hypothetical protein
MAHVDDPAENFNDPVISEDRRSVAFSEEMVVDASYQVPGLVFVYRDGKAADLKGPDGNPHGECFDGGGSQSWAFVAAGRQFTLACAFEHGLPHEYRSLFDLATGKLIGQVPIDDDAGKPPRNAPDWAK